MFLQRFLLFCYKLKPNIPLYFNVKSRILMQSPQSYLLAKAHYSPPVWGFHERIHTSVYAYFTNSVVNHWNSSPYRVVTANNILYVYPSFPACGFVLVGLKN